MKCGFNSCRSYQKYGEMAERLKASVLKIDVLVRHRGFESLFPRQIGRIAQLAEQPALNRQVTGSKPVAATMILGKMAERLKAPAC